MRITTRHINARLRMYFVSASKYAELNLSERLALRNAVAFIKGLGDVRRDTT